jgi:hypothetical protein
LKRHDTGDNGSAVTITKIRELYEAQPFRPFVMRLADGRNIPVRHPDFLMPAPSCRTLVVFQPDDSLNIVDVMLVTDLEIKRPNGSHARRR